MQDLVYPAIFQFDKEDDSYFVYFPDWTGVTEGDTLEEAFHMACDCLLCMVDGEKALPSPASYEEVVKKHPNDVVLLVKPVQWVHPNLRKSPCAEAQSTPIKLDCPCPKTTCKNHGKCADCVVKHKNTDSLPYCLFPAENGDKSNLHYYKTLKTRFDKE